MARKGKNRGGLYLYAVVAGDEEGEFTMLGVEGGRVHGVNSGRVGAVVSEVADRNIRPRRLNIAAHQNVLTMLMRKSTPLPITFGAIAGDKQEVLEILSDHEDTFLEQLERVRDKVEMGLRVQWDVPNIFEYFVNTHADLREARDLFFLGKSEAGHEEKLEVGRMFERILREEREDHISTVLEVLSSSCTDIKQNAARSELEVMNLSCLVIRKGQKAFEDDVFVAASRFDNSFSFNINGPWAPYNFVEVHVDNRSTEC